MDRVRNKVFRITRIERELVSRVDQRALIWFGDMERMDECCIAIWLMMAEVSRGGVYQ